MSTSNSTDYDVIAVGAGFAGISLSYHLRPATTSRYLTAQRCGRHLGMEQIPAQRQTVSPITTA